VFLRGILGHDGLYQFEHNNSFKTTAPVSQNFSVNTVCNKVPAQIDSSASFHLGPSTGFNFSNFQCSNVEHLPSSSTSSSTHLFLPCIVFGIADLDILIMRCSKVLSNFAIYNYQIIACQIFVLLVVLVRFIDCHLLHLK